MHRWRKTRRKVCRSTGLLSIPLPVFFRNAVFRHLVGFHFHFTCSVGVFYALDHFSLVGISFFQQFFHAFRSRTLHGGESLNVSCLSARAGAHTACLVQRSLQHRRLAAGRPLLFCSSPERGFTTSRRSFRSEFLFGGASRTSGFFVLVALLAFLWAGH